MKKSIKYIQTLFILVLCVLQVNACGVINKSVDNDNKSKKEAIDEEDDEDTKEGENVDKKEANKKKKKQKDESSEVQET